MKATDLKGIHKHIQFRFGHHQFTPVQILLGQSHYGQPSRLCFISFKPLIGAIEVGEKAPGVLLKGSGSNPWLAIEMHNVKIRAEHLLPEGYRVCLLPHTKWHRHVCQGSHPVRVQQGMVPDKNSPPVMANKNCLVITQGIQQAVVIIRQLMAVISLHWLGSAGMAIAPLVGHNDMKARLNQWGYLVAPAKGMFRPAMAEHQGYAAASLKDFQLNAIGKADHFWFGKGVIHCYSKVVKNAYIQRQTANPGWHGISSSFAKKIG